MSFSDEDIINMESLKDLKVLDEEESENEDIACLPIKFICPTITRQLEGVKIHSDKFNMEFTAYIQDETTPTQQRCYIMTVHDIGCDYTSFQEFISCNEMRGLKDRIIWLHVDLPGQEAHAADIQATKYPSLPDLASELVLVLDHFKISQVVCLGEGAGANICARFAMQHPTRCHGVALIHPTGSTASFMESFKDKINGLRLFKPNSDLSPTSEEYLIWHRFGHSSGDHELVQSNIKEFQTKLYQNRNAKNLSLFVDAYLNRSNILDKIDELKVDCLVSYGRKASLSSETKKFYKTLCDSRRENLQKIVNCPLVEVEEVGDVMGETPDRLALSLQFFLQGMGLLTAMPMRRTLQGLGRLSRTYSMEEADRPRLSISEPFQTQVTMVK